MRLSRFVSTIALVAAASAVLAAPAQAAPDDCAASNLSVDKDWSAYEGKNVALVIHGWRGTPMVEAADMLGGQLPASEWAVGTFSYENSNGDWPDADSDVVECLRATILQYAGATGRTGPSIYLVTHSMGGIVARVALNLASDRQFDDIVGGLVTIDTPHRGSPWGNTWAAKALPQTKTTAGSMPAHQCLALHHPGALPAGCELPPAISPGIPILQIAGDVTLTRTYFMIGRSEVDTLSDGIVWMESQAGYRNSVDEPLPVTGQATSSVVRCEYGWGAALAAAPNLIRGDPSLWWDGTIATAMQSGTAEATKYDAAVAVLGGASIAAPCGHGPMAKNPDAITRAASQLSEWARANADGWEITADGIGPLRVGETTWDEASALPGFEGHARDWAERSCVAGGWFGSGSAHDGLSLLAAGPEGSPGAIDVVSLSSYFRSSSSEPAATAGGIGLGSPESDIVRLYPSAPTVPNMLAPAIVDYRIENGSGRAMVFGVEAGVVTYIAVGNIPDVYAVEGCA
ncbi:hypothetical protein ABY45_16390 [Microbacterium maritypicum]|uniref:lipase family alpha/beta hydrolase n=1 Tax=Microbacterium maritypicum TaxID=33918 RepID=UPI003D6F6908